LITKNKIAHLNYVSYLLPSNIITNKLLAERYPEYTENQIYKNTRINKRFAVEKGLLSSDFGTQSGEKLFNECPIKKEDIDFLIFCTECPDYNGPATSCIIQHKLGLPTSIGTLDLSFGCSGYTYGLSIAKALIESGVAKNVLFITADIASTFLPANDINLNFLFGDGASASVISKKEIGQSIGNFCFGTDGSGERNLMIRNTAYREPKDEEWITNPENKGLTNGRLEMDGVDIFRFSIDKIPKLTEEILTNNDCKIEEIDLFIFHQASTIILKSLKRKLRIPDDKFFTNLAEVGNTISASIPIAFVDAHKQGKIKPNMKILIAGFGIGYSWSGTIIQTKN